MKTQNRPRFEVDRKAPCLADRNRKARQSAFTMVEMMVTMGIFLMVVTGLVYVHLFGLKQDQLVESQLGASDQARIAFNQMTSDIRSAKIWYIGGGNNTSFTKIPSGTTQVSNALQISLTVNTNTFIRYYFDSSTPGDYKLMRMHSPSGSTPTLIADNLIAPLAFSAENQQGTTMTSIQWRYVVHVMLQFQEYQYPLTQIGTNFLYDYYKMEFRVTPHAPD